VRKTLPKVETVFISSVTGMGLDDLKDRIWDKLQA